MQKREKNIISKPERGRALTFGKFLELQVTNVPQSMDPDGLLLTVAGAERQPYFYRFAVHYPRGMDARDAEFTVGKCTKVWRMGLSDIGTRNGQKRVKMTSQTEMQLPKSNWQPNGRFPN